MFNDLIASSTKASFLNTIIGTNVVGSNLSLRNTIFRQAENDFSEHPEKVIDPKSTDFQKRLRNGY
jgi:hypothetical protein